MEKKVIKVDFIKKKRVEEEPGEDVLEGIGDNLRKHLESEGEDSPLVLLTKLARHGVMFDRIEEIERNTKDFSQEVFAERKKGVHSYTNDQLINFFVKSNSIEWHKDPAFYRAIASEIRERLKMMLNNLDWEK